MWNYLPSGTSTGGIILILLLVLFMLIKIIARYYKKIQPNTVAVVTGRKHKVKVAGPDGTDQIVTRGYRTIVGGGFFLVPIVEEMKTMSLTVIPVSVQVRDIPDKNGVLINVDGIANIKVMSTTELLPLAIERFLGETSDEIKETCFMTLEGNLRGVIGTLTVEDLLRDREKFQSNVMTEAGVDLNKMGIGVDTFKIQSITDDHDYIKSLGLKQTAEIVRNAAVGQAEAKRDTDKQSAEAQRIGQTAQAESQKAISIANRDRDITVAENEAQVAAKRAMIPIAAEIAQAERTKELNVATVGAKKAQVTAEIELQEETGKRNAAEYSATIVVKADKEREALIIGADAKQQAALREGEAARITAEKTGLGFQAQQTAEAEGRKAAAAATQAELVAQANGEQAMLVAKAEGVKAMLLAEAEGALKKAEAYKALDEGGRFLLILQSLPPVIDSLGDALQKVATPVADAIGKGIGNVKDIKIIDMGGSGKAPGSNVVSQFANLPVETMFGLWQKVQALGLEPVVRSAAKRFGFDIDAALKDAPASVTASAAITEPTAPEAAKA
jgi:flotillin